MTSGISTVDFAPFLNGSELDKKEVSNQILDSFKSTGFVHLINHGLSLDKVKGMFDMVR